MFRMNKDLHYFLSMFGKPLNHKSQKPDPTSVRVATQRTSLSLPLSLLTFSLLFQGKCPTLYSPTKVGTFSSVSGDYDGIIRDPTQ